MEICPYPNPYLPIREHPTFSNICYGFLKLKLTWRLAYLNLVRTTYTGVGWVINPYKQACLVQGLVIIYQ